MKYRGSCHCGAVTYDVEVDLSGGVNSCNCSHCAMVGWLITFVPASQFTLLSGEGNLQDYQFNKKHIHHLFCKTCGIESFARGKGRDGADTVAINVRCLKGVNLEALTINSVNGRDL